LTYKNHCGKNYLPQETCILYPAPFHLSASSKKFTRKYFVDYFTSVIVKLIFDDD
jgi:hypothetical protein